MSLQPDALGLMCNDLASELGSLQDEAEVLPAPPQLLLVRPVFEADPREARRNLDALATEDTEQGARSSAHMYGSGLLPIAGSKGRT